MKPSRPLRSQLAATHCRSRYQQSASLHRTGSGIGRPTTVDSSDSKLKPWNASSAWWQFLIQYAQKCITPPPLRVRRAIFVTAARSEAMASEGVPFTYHRGTPEISSVSVCICNVISWDGLHLSWFVTPVYWCSSAQVLLAVLNHKSALFCIYTAQSEDFTFPCGHAFIHNTVTHSEFKKRQNNIATETLLPLVSFKLYLLTYLLTWKLKISLASRHRSRSEWKCIAEQSVHVHVNVCLWLMNALSTLQLSAWTGTIRLAYVHASL